MVSCLDCFYVCHSHCESVVTDTTAKEPSFPFIANSRMDDVLLHGVWLQHRLQPSTWLHMAAQTVDITRAMDINMAPSPSWAMHTNMSSGCSTDHRHHRGLWWKHGPHTSTWLLGVTWATDINMVSSGSMTHRHQPDFRWQFRPLMFPWPLVLTWSTDISMVHPTPALLCTRMKLSTDKKPNFPTKC